MSAPRKDDGGYAIDPAELFRVFEPKPAGQGDTSGPGCMGQTGQVAELAGPSAGTGVTDARAAALEAEIQALKELVRRLDLDKQEMARRFDLDKQDLKADRDAWKSQAERLALAGPAQQQRGLWSWWRRSA
jgi:hypothetical protein